MAHFDLSQYQTVQERIDLFRKEYPTGRIVNEIAYIDEKSIIVRTEIYLNVGDTEPTCVDLAHEVKDASPVNRTSWVENAATSATGRAISLLGGKFSPKGKRPSREEMQKVERASVTKISDALVNIDPSTAKTLDELTEMWNQAVSYGRAEELQPKFTARKQELTK